MNLLIKLSWEEGDAIGGEKGLGRTPAPGRSGALFAFA
jgi:hypothetical protein